MGLFSKDIATMDDLLLRLKDIYYAENQIVKSLPKLIDKSTNRDLAKSLSDHLEETRKQINRLDQVLKKLGEEAQEVQCPAIDGLLAEAEGEIADKQVLDAAIVGAAQSDELGHDDVVRLLTTNLNDEKAADKKLSTVALRKRGEPPGGALKQMRPTWHIDAH